MEHHNLSTQAPSDATDSPHNDCKRPEEKDPFASHSATTLCWCCTGLALMHRKTAYDPMESSKSRSLEVVKNRRQSTLHRKGISNRHAISSGESQLATSSLMSLSASQNRIRIQGAFCGLFFPAGGDAFHSLFHNSEPRGRTLTAAEQVRTDAADVLCLIQVALVASRRDLLLQAMRMYGRTLQRLQNAVAHPRTSQSYDSLIAAVYFLIKCEAFLCTSWTSRGWMQHTLAFVQLLSAGLDEGETVGFGRWCFLSFSYCYALGYGLLNKRRINYEPWLEGSDPTYRLHMASAMRVPSCLEGLEAVRQKDAGPDRTRKAVRSALRIRGQLLEKLAHVDVSATSPPYRRVDLSRYPQFLATVGPPGRLFPIAFDFSDFGTAMAHRDTWVQLLVLDQTILDLRRQRWYLLGEIYIKELEGLEGELEQVSTNLCQSVPYFAQPQIRCAGRVAIPEALHFLEEYFATIDASKHVHWCEAVRQATSLGHRISKILSFDQV